MLFTAKQILAGKMVSIHSVERDRMKLWLICRCRSIARRKVGKASVKIDKIC
jgi:hypothetical protein